MENVFIEFYLPEFDSVIPILRFSTIKLYEDYYKLKFANEDHRKEIIKKLLINLEHNHIAVRTQSAISVRYFVKSDKTIELLRPYVPNIVDKILKMLQENEHEDLILTLQEFVNSFTNEIIP